jgi:hypothetical protein
LLSPPAAAGGLEEQAVARLDPAAVNARELTAGPVRTEDDLSSNRAAAASGHAVRRAHPVLAEDRQLERRQELDLAGEAVAAAPAPCAP